MLKKMMGITLLILIGAIAFLSCGGNVNDRETDLQSLIAAERAFAAMSISHSMKEAFLANLADDGIVFQPKPTNGKEVWEATPESEQLLVWEPVYADIANSGDFGYTTGPWVLFKDSNKSEALVYGQYISIWKKQADSSWKVALDIGISHDKPTMPMEELATGKAVPFKGQSQDILFNSDILIGNDKANANLSRTEGTVTAFNDLTGDDVRFYRERHFPILSKAKAVKYLEDIKGVLNWESEFADVASSGDLGYTRGTAVLRNSETPDENRQYTYVKIWKRTSSTDWQVVLDIALGFAN